MVTSVTCNGAMKSQGRTKRYMASNLRAMTSNPINSVGSIDKRPNSLSRRQRTPREVQKERTINLVEGEETLGWRP